MAIMVSERPSRQEAWKAREASGEGAKPGALTRLTLSGFRSFAEASLAFNAARVVFLGPNGAGKTNLLEAVSLLAPGRGLKGAKLSDITRRGGNAPTAGWSIAAEIAGLAGQIKIGTGLKADALGRDRRAWRFEGETARPTEVAAHVRIAWLTPAMDRLFEDSAGGRRRFFDRLVATFDTSHGARLTRYERALTERQRLLKDGIEEDGWFTGLERIMAEEGVAIAAARRQMLAALERQIAAGGPWTDEELFPCAHLALEGALEAALDKEPAVRVEAAFEEALAAGRARDGAAGRALEGVHRTDLAVRYGAKDMPAGDCSTGEQKALLLNIVLAHVRALAEEAGPAPILLLDEIMAHLDETRRAALLDALGAAGAQVFMTGTDEAAFSSLGGGAQVFDIARGEIRPRDSDVSGSRN